MSFCSIEVHQGKKIISRSMDSITMEIRGLTRHPEWKGFISDIGGATAEMYGNDCETDACLNPLAFTRNVAGCFLPGKDIWTCSGNAKNFPGSKRYS